MPFHGGQVVPIQEPVDLFSAEREDLFLLFRPVEFLLRQHLIVEDEAVILPHQPLDTITVSVTEYIECTTKGVLPQFTLYDGSQSVNLFAEVYRVPIEIDLWDIEGGAKGVVRSSSCTTVSI